jgi:hypothetical protein
MRLQFRCARARQDRAGPEPSLALRHRQGRREHHLGRRPDLRERHLARRPGHRARRLAADLHPALPSRRNRHRAGRRPSRE